MDISKTCTGLQITVNKACAKIEYSGIFQYTVPQSVVQNCLRSVMCVQRRFSQDGHQKVKLPPIHPKRDKSVTSVSSGIQNCITYLDCKQKWFSQDGSLIADPSDPESWIDSVISASSDRLVLSRCVDVIHESTCHSADGTPFIGKTLFKVTDEPAETPVPNDLNEGIPVTPVIEVTPDLQSSDLLWLLLAVPFIPVLFIILILIYLKRRKMTSRDPEADVQQRLRSDSPDSLN